ncbi:translocation/assembly module TamB domain-containing protein [Sneathiella sp.]|uniref:translocation/assembly module TamB domain-containing protein n=1 Tax=Sneathiella sp. TaxID=1964365 RepID=UPI0035659B97
MSRKSIIAIVLATPFVLLLAAGVGLYGFAQTDSGRDLLVRQIEAAVDQPDGLQMHLGQLEGNIFGEFTVAALQLQGPSGEWLTVKDLSVSWSPLALLGARLKINDIDIQSLALERQPDLPASPKEETSGGSIWPLPVDITLTRFRIADIRIAELVLGQETRLALLMNLNAETADAIHSELKLTEIGGNGGDIHGVVNFHPDHQTLEVDVKLNEPEGGLLSRALGLPGYPAIKAAIVGNGVLNAWRGEIRASAGRLFDADFAISTRGDKVIDVDLKGGGAFDEEFAKSLPLVDSSRFSVTAALSWDTKGGDIILKSSDIENTTFTATASGRVNMDTRELSAKLKTNLRDAAALNEIMAPAAVSKAAMDLDVDGTFDKITANAILRANGLMVEDSLAANEMTGTFTSTLVLDQLDTIPVKGSAALVGVSKLPTEAKSLLGDNLDLDFEATYTLASQFLKVTTLRLAGKHLKADGQGEVAIGEGTANAVLSVALDDLTVVVPVGGKVMADITLESRDIGSKMTGRIVAHARNVDMGDPGLQAIVSRDVTLTSNVSLADEILRAEGIELSLGAGRVTGNAEIPLSFETLTANLKAGLDSLAPLSQIAGVMLAGKAALDTRITGALSDPDIKGTLALTSLEAEATPIGDVKTNFNVASLASSPVGSFDLHLAHQELSADAAGRFTLPDYSRLELAGLSIKQQENTISGDLSIPFNGTPLSGSIMAKIPDLGSIAEIAGQKAAGAAEMTAVLANKNGKQSVNATLSGNNFSLNGGEQTMGSMTATVSSLGAFANPDIDLKLDAKSISAAGISFKAATVTASGNPKNLDYGFELDREADPTLQLSGKGALELGGDSTKIELTTLQGALAKKKISLITPFRLDLHGEDITVDDFQLALGDGTISGSAALTRAAADAGIKISKLPLDLLALISPDTALTGTLDGTANLSVKPGTDSRATVSLIASDVRIAGEEFTAFPTFSSTFEGNLKDGQFQFNGDVNGLDATTIETAGAVPMTISSAPFAFAVDDNKPVNINVNIDSDINKIWALLALDTQKLTGTLKAEAKVSGTIAEPVIVGKARLSGGTYENLEQGTELGNLALKADIEKSQILTLEASGADKNGGTFKSTGSIRFDDLTDPQLDMNVALNNLLVLNREDVVLTTDSDIDIKGGMAALDVTGSVTTRQADINIGGSPGPTIAEIKVEEINRPGATSTAEEKAGNDLLANIALNLDLSLPKRVFIRGRGLDSKWEGEFTVKGTANKPVIEGYLSPVRGQFTFAGKSFTLQDGKILLVGGREIDPELSLSAKYETPDITAIVSITGTVSDPTISFSSPSGLPEDEVLAQVLFGKSSGKLSTLEALQLAETLGTLSGKLGGGGGIMGFARKTLGVDVINAGTDAETGKTEVSVGKYVSDNVYVGVDQGAESGSTRAKVQIELSPHISVESKVGQSTNSSVGIFFKWDY